MNIKVKRVYKEPEKADGMRVLVDRLWPHGLSKDKAKVEIWLKDIAPTDELRKWFGHDPARWDEFRRRYFAELSGKKTSFEVLLEELGKGTVTLLYAAKDEEHNNAVALKEYVESGLHLRDSKAA
jgi:uncharacterized protein YeaO (DUF488 family)